MKIKAVFVIDTDDEECDPVEKIEDLLNTIVSNNECVADYASIYKRKNEKEGWKEV